MEAQKIYFTLEEVRNIVFSNIFQSQRCENSLLNKKFRLYKFSVKDSSRNIGSKRNQKSIIRSS